MSGCETPNKPPLPKCALGAAPPKATEDEKWTATVNRADVIYFGLTKRSAAETEPAWPLVEVLQRNGARVALGWTELSTAQQPILDQWQRAEISPQQLLDQLVVPDRGDRLGHALRPDLVQIALGFATGTRAQDPRRHCPHGSGTRVPAQVLQAAPRCLR
jgi:hypothetical protein